ncbi:hypothetical protein EVAR_75830_1 [Eumeta japonica]|uniref:Histone-lysine N-methyltransferase SETMAR n=1 Tax=Eumeta variegata TaxID=151549 RepID=A0A4C1TE47_EUMVA|nr:hypothetical protein EVAR_75830_1 [Eumeta japonica]
MKTLGIEILAHPPYSPDLAPCDFYSLPKIKEKLRGKWFTDAEEVVASYEKVVKTILKFEWEKWFYQMQRWCPRRLGMGAMGPHDEKRTLSSRAELKMSRSANFYDHFGFQCRSYHMTMPLGDSFSEKQRHLPSERLRPGGSSVHRDQRPLADIIEGMVVRKSSRATENLELDAFTRDNINSKLRHPLSRPKESRGRSLALLESYLSGRIQRADVNGERSSGSTVNMGVPQFSIYEPPPKILVIKSAVTLARLRIGGVAGRSAVRGAFNGLIIKYLMKFVFSARCAAGVRGGGARGRAGRSVPLRAAAGKAPHLITPARYGKIAEKKFHREGT